MSDWSFGAVGDVFVHRDDPEDAFKYSSGLLHKIDLVFGNCEGAYTDQTETAPSAGWRVVSSTGNGEKLREAGFDVMACANNHTVDAGHRGLMDTLSLLQRQGIKTVGAGANAAEAHAAVGVSHRGVNVGFLAYASVYQAGYEARGSLPGLAAMRIHSHYYIPDSDPYGRVEPGAPPTIRTFPYPEDLERLRTSIADARQVYDVVIVSFHMGQASLPAIMTEYEFVLARSAIDFGADVVVGHHHHFLRGMEIYRGHPIFYGLGHFVFDLPGLGNVLDAVELSRLRARGEYAIYPREGYPLSPFHPDARMTMVAICNFRGRDIQAAGFFPCLINQDNHAVPLQMKGDQARRLASYVESIGNDAGLTTRYEIAELLPGLEGIRIAMEKIHSS